MSRAFYLVVFFFFINEIAYAQGRWQGYNLGDFYSETDAISSDTINKLIYIGTQYVKTSNSEVENKLLVGNGNLWDSTFYIARNMGYIDALIMYNGTLYIGLNGDSIGYVLSYNGDTSTILGSFDGPVKCLAEYHDTLFAAGGFGVIYGDTLNNITKWDGTKWEKVDSGFWINYFCCSEIDAMAIYDNQLIAGGIFNHAGGNWAYGIASYNGNVWQPLQLGVGDTSISGLPGTVQALEVYNNKLYVGGAFTTVNDTIKTDGLATWDEEQWSSAATNLESAVLALDSCDGYLFIGGYSGYAGQFIYKYDGNNLSTVDSGVSIDVFSLNSLENYLYVGGQFDTVGKTIFANGIARWTPDTATGIEQIQMTNKQISIYPNPSETTLNINYNISQQGITDIFDVFGRKVIEFTLYPYSKSRIIYVNQLPAVYMNCDLMWVMKNW